MLHKCHGFLLRHERIAAAVRRGFVGPMSAIEATVLELRHDSGDRHL